MTAKYNGTREAFAAAMLELAEEVPNLAIVCPDSLKAMRAVEFGEKYPERYVECGIAEQCAVDVAAGLATAGVIPFVGTYGGFLTMRACEQMRTFVGYTNLNVKFIGVNGGLIGGEREGVTHQFYEELAIVSSFPNYTIFTPSDPEQCYEACKLAVKTPGPVYIRAASGKEPNIFPAGTPFSPTGITVIKDYGNDAVLFSNGYVLDRVMKAADLLKDEGINVTVADINILYGKDPSAILQVMAKSQQLFTIEDHNINGGVGSYISRLACEHKPAFVTRIALTTYGESGPAKELADAYGFSPEAIANKVKETLKK